MMPLWLSALLVGPAETTRYMVAGYLVIFLVLGLYLVSLAVRQSRLRAELAWLDEAEPGRQADRQI